MENKTEEENKIKAEMSQSVGLTSQLPSGCLSR